MISYQYKIYDFLEHIKGKDAREAIYLAQREAGDASMLTAGGRRGAPLARAQGCDRYENELGALISFLNNASKPSGISDSLFVSFVHTGLTLSGYKQEFYDKCNSLLQIKPKN